MPKCKVCGRDYVRKECDFCKREQKWNKYIQTEKMQPLPKRIFIQLKGEIIAAKPLSFSEYMQGGVGKGKSVKACKRALGAVKLDYIEQRFSVLGYYNVSELLLRLRQSFSADAIETEKAIYDEVRAVDYLILDDLGAEKGSEWALQTLYVIINHRYDNLLPTIVTSNFSLEELSEKLGDYRISSRLSEMCGKLPVVGPNMRK